MVLTSSPSKGIFPVLNSNNKVKESYIDSIKASVQEVNKLLEQFGEYKKMMKGFANGNMNLPF